MCGHQGMPILMRQWITELVGRFGLVRPVFALRFFLVRLRPSALWRNFRGGTPDGAALPSTWARIRNTGTTDVQWFHESGSLSANTVREAVADLGLEMREFGRILDFGCGCGRVLRHWRDLEHVEIYGTDYQQRLIDECRQVVPFVHLSVNGLEPPLPFADASFDLVYSFSVFTHLDERQQLAWRDEIRRVLKPGGVLVMSTQGLPYMDRMNRTERERFEGGDVVCQRRDYRGENICQTYHPEQYVRGAFSDGLSVVDYQREGARGCPPQDLYVLRRLDAATLG